MCAECREAVAERKAAAERLREVCEGFGLRPALKLVYRLEAPPNDMLEMAMRIGGQA